MSILSSLIRYAEHYRRQRSRARTIRQITSLPLEIRKDIGWDMAERDERRGPARSSRS